MLWLDQQSPIRGSRMDKAVTYIQNRRSYLPTYLEDGRCSFSNNLSENAIRPFTVGRKNWLFCDTPNGASQRYRVHNDRNGKSQWSKRLSLSYLSAGKTA